MATVDTQTWYEVNKWRPFDIKPVTVKKATDKTLLIADDTRKGEHRTNIVSEYTTYYPTIEAAVRAARIRCERSISAAQRTIEQARADLAKLAAAYPAEYEQQQEAAQ